MFTKSSNKISPSEVNELDVISKENPKTTTQTKSDVSNACLRNKFKIIYYVGKKTLSLL